MRLTQGIKTTIQTQLMHAEWKDAGQGWEGTEQPVQLSGWSRQRRGIILRRALKEEEIPKAKKKNIQPEFDFGEAKTPAKNYEYAVLVTSLKEEIFTIGQFYRDRADSENVFDELKNQWSWGSFTTHDLSRCQIMVRHAALIYNWWSLFVRLIIPDRHAEAITSRPLLLYSVGKKTTHAGQTKLTVTSMHRDWEKVKSMFIKVTAFLGWLRANAEQLDWNARWRLILSKVSSSFLGEKILQSPKLEWVKINREGDSVEEKKKWIEAENSRISFQRQCEIIGLPRSSWYYEPCGESSVNLWYMHLIDKEFTRHPFYGVRRMTEWLKGQDYEVNVKRVRWLMRVMGLVPIYPKPRLSLGNKEDKKYPYLLRDLQVTRSNQVWCIDITYIRMAKGFVYLTAVMDWFSRYVLSWKISNSLDVTFCLEALEEALKKGKPDIFNSDQGSQFTSQDFTGRLEKENIRISRDGRGRAFDNIFIERLWRSVKYEEVYIKDYASVPECIRSLREYFRFYNEERLHQALQYKTTLEVHQQSLLN